MKKRERTARLAHLTQYIAETQVAMGLTHWEMLVNDEPPDDDTALATCEPVTGRYMANLWITDAALVQSPEDLRNTVVHELLHVHEWGFIAVVDDLSPDIGAQAWRIWRENFRRQVEYMTDTLTVALAKHLPPPPPFTPPPE